MFAALRLDGGAVGRAVLISLLGELGDKTFYLILALAAWCPWQGLRTGGTAPAERCLVFAGASAAFNVRAVLLASAQDFMKWGCWPEAVACVVLALMGAKAALDQRRASDRDLNPFLLSKDSTESPCGLPGCSSETSWNSSAFASYPRIPAAALAAEKNPFPAESPQDASGADEAQWNSAAFGARHSLPENGEGQAPSYGAASPLPSAARAGGARRGGGGTMASLLLAFPVAFTMVLIMESDDKSESALQHASSGGAEVVVGAILGFLPAALLATFAGHVLERQLDGQHSLLLVAFLLFSLSLVSLSQALLHLGALQPPAPDVAPVGGGGHVRGGHG